MSEIDDVDDFLAHHGVKGMKWGRRKPKDTSSQTTGSKVSSGSSGKPNLDDSEKSRIRKERAKKVAIGVGILVVAAGAAYAGHKLQQNGSLNVKDLPKTSKAVKDKVDSIQKEPTALIYAGRVKDKGFQFYRKGDLADPFHEYMGGPFGRDADSSEMFERYGSNNEKIAARFQDPRGRKDQAGRVIPHEVVIPKSMASGINNLDDVKKKIWPLLESEYDKMYKESEERKL